MKDPFYIVKDSSIWFNSDNYSLVNRFDGLIRVGIIKRAVNDKNTGEIRYLVEVQNHGDRVELNCIMMRRFGGVYNYEDYIYQGYNINDKPDPVNFYEAKAGDAVIVSFLNGQGREGVILGGITHRARNTELNANDGPQYKSEINGLETIINKDGEMIVTFKGVPTNVAILNAVPSKKIPKPTYNTAIGTSYYKFDKAGSFMISDNSQSGGAQSLILDKPNGSITLSSGAASLKLNKSAQAISLSSKTLSISASEATSLTTKTFKVDAQTSASIKAAKVAIGKEGIELLDQIAQLVDAISNLAPISPVGPCTPLITAPQWSQVESVKSKIKSITGAL